MCECNNFTVNFYVSEDFLLNELHLAERENNPSDDEYMRDNIEIDGESDYLLATAVRGKRMIEISTTCCSYNIYLFTSNIDENGDADTVDVENISHKLDELRSYEGLFDFIYSVIGGLE